MMGATLALSSAHVIRKVVQSPDPSDHPEQQATPELGLHLAIVLQVIEDLTSSDERVCFDAHEFLLQPRGPWAESRRLYFGLLGLDEESVVQALRGRLNPPERPSKKWTSMEVYAVLPPYAFKAMDISAIVGLRYSQITARLHHLRGVGLLKCVDRGIFVRTNCLEAYYADSVTPMQKTFATVFDALDDGPKTVREIALSLTTPLDDNAIRKRLSQYLATGKATKEDATWKIAA